MARKRRTLLVLIKCKTSRGSVRGPRLAGKKIRLSTFNKNSRCCVIHALIYGDDPTYAVSLEEGDPPLRSCRRSASTNIALFNRPTRGIARAKSTFQFGDYLDGSPGQRFRCLLARLARRCLRNRVFAEGAGGHVTPDTS